MDDNNGTPLKNANLSIFLEVCVPPRIYTLDRFKDSAVATQEWQQTPLYLLGDLDHPSMVSRLNQVYIYK